MTINANFTGMSNPNQSILFLSNSCGMLLPGPWRKPPASWNLRFSRFSGEFHSSCLQYSHLIRTCQEPGLNILAEIRQLPVKRFPGARCAAVPTQKTAQNGDFHWGVWEFRTLHAAGIPGSLFQKPRTSAIYDKGVWEFDAAYRIPGT